MFEPFPLPSGNQDLTAEDVRRFSHAFANIVLRKIPTAKHVRFIFSEQQLKESVKAGSDADLTALFYSVSKSAGQCGRYHDFLMISFALQDDTIAVALLSDLDPLFVKRVKDEWLSNVLDEMKRDFLLLKQARLDEQTGLFNLANLRLILDNPLADKPVQLTLIEIPLGKSSFQLMTKHLHKCVLSLQTCIPDGAIVHHLGNALFAIVFELQGGSGCSQFTTSLAAYLKEEGFRRVHVGTSHSNRTDYKNTQSGAGRRLLDEAWTALHVAVRRGPFGFCDFALLAYPESHPLVRPEQNLVRRLRRLWKKSEQFCLVYFRSDDAGYPAEGIVKRYLDRGTVVQAGNDLVLYLERGDGQTVVKWAEDIVRRCAKIDPGRTVSAGVSCFPYSDFKKSETLYNCRKALAHAAFFGKSGVALFDSVSLNISGDMYFSDGDLLKAVKEYRRGLKCDADNVNLHNSLGVTLAMMNKFSAAMICFKNALKLDENNFMALYNIGLGKLNHNKKKEALFFFKRALNCLFEDTPDEHTLKNELRRQIGILASETGEYQLALDNLVLWHESCVSERQSGRVAFYIGSSYYGLGNSRKAMEWLQRALRSNEYDDRAMHLLGKVYHQEGEGDEIALTLSRKSVELDPGNMEYRMGLAHIQIHCGMIRDARENLKQCLKSLELKAEVQLSLAQCYLESGHNKRAAHWFNKVAAEDGSRFKRYNELKQRLMINRNI